MAKKRGLGKGLDALIPPQIDLQQELESNDQNKVILLDIDRLKPNKYQPRKGFDEEKLQELAKSIKEHGVVQPIVVRAIKGRKYEIVAGERRWRACKLLGLKNVPAVIKEYSNQELTEIALIENIQREDLNPLEEAFAYNILIEEYSLTQEMVANKIGKSRSFVANMLRLLQLDRDVQKMLVEGKLSGGHARALLAFDRRMQTDVARIIIKKGLNVRQTERLVKNILKGKEDAPSNKNIKKPATVLEFENSLKEVLGTKVNIKGRDKGKVEIEYYSPEDLERIIEYIIG